MPDSPEADSPATEPAGETTSGGEVMAAQAPGATSEASVVSVTAEGTGKDTPETTPCVKRVLVVEDSKPLQRMLEKLLLKEGFEVLVADNGKLAIDLLKAADTPPIDLMLLDIMMPEMDGIATMAHIKKENIPAPPIIICSARSDQETVTLSQRLGARNYILKPFKTDVVLTKVRATLYS